MAMTMAMTMVVLLNKSEPVSILTTACFAVAKLAYSKFILSDISIVQTQIFELNPNLFLLKLAMYTVLQSSASVNDHGFVLIGSNCHILR